MDFNYVMKLCQSHTRNMKYFNENNLIYHIKSISSYKHDKLQSIYYKKIVLTKELIVGCSFRYIFILKLNIFNSMLV